jgi:hypothetical protein
VDELRDIRGRLITIVVLIAAALLIGTAGYHLVEGWSFFVGLYMTVITLATVGYGETNPNPDSRKPIRAGDSLVRIGEMGELAKLRERFGSAA